MAKAEPIINQEMYEEYSLGDTIYFDITQAGQKVLDKFIESSVGMMSSNDRKQYVKVVNKRFIDFKTGKIKMKFAQFVAIFGSSVLAKIDNTYIKDNKFYIKRRINEE